MKNQPRTDLMNPRKCTVHLIYQQPGVDVWNIGTADQHAGLNGLLMIYREGSQKPTESESMHDLAL